MAIINKETIISAFDDKMTLLQYLKNIDKVLENGVLKSVSLIRVDDGHVKLRFYFMDGTTQDTNEIVIGETDLTTLATLIEGSESVVVDVNEEGTALEVHIDAEVMQKINRALLLPMTTPTEQELVGVDTANGQNRITIGDNLEVENNILKLKNDIIVNTFAQTTPNFSIDFIFNQPTNLVLTNIYNRFMILGNILYIIANISIENTTENAVSLGTINSGWVSNIPQYVCEKIIDLDGQAVTSTNNIETLITLDTIRTTKSLTSPSEGVYGYFQIYNRQAKNVMTTKLSFDNNLSLAPGEKIYICGRTALTLL